MKQKIFSFIVGFLGGMAGLSCLHAEVSLPSLFSDHFANLLGTESVRGYSPRGVHPPEVAFSTPI
jgi:hypothetical protein